MAQLRSLSRRLALFASIAVVTAAVTACGQGEGDRCEINSDCKGGLECMGAAPNKICVFVGTVAPMDAASLDGPVVDDASVGQDGPADAASAGDAGVDAPVTPADGPTDARSDVAPDGTGDARPDTAGADASGG